MRCIVYSPHWLRAILSFVVKSDFYIRTQAWGFRRCSFRQLGRCQSLYCVERVTELAPRFHVYIPTIINHVNMVAVGKRRIIGMSSIKVPITKTDKGGFQVTIDLNLYSEKAITATIYRYTDKYFVYQNTMPSDDKQACVIFESKDGALDENIVKQFCNDLIDQQLREITTEKYGHIRDLIVEEAFKPISK